MTANYNNGKIFKCISIEPFIPKKDIANKTYSPKVKSLEYIWKKKKVPFKISRNITFFLMTHIHNKSIRQIQPHNWAYNMRTANHQRISDVKSQLLLFIASLFIKRNAIKDLFPERKGHNAKFRAIFLSPKFFLQFSGMGSPFCHLPH